MGNKLQMQDLAEAVVKSTNCSKKNADTFIRTMFDMIEEFLETDEYVKIKGLGTFKLIMVGKRESINVNTGERFEIDGHSKVTFTPDSNIKELINKPFAQFQSVVINDETKIEEIEQVTNRIIESEQTPEPEPIAEPIRETIEDLQSIDKKAVCPLSLESQIGTNKKDIPTIENEEAETESEDFYIDEQIVDEEVATVSERDTQSDIAEEIESEPSLSDVEDGELVSSEEGDDTKETLKNDVLEESLSLHTKSSDIADVEQITPCNNTDETEVLQVEKKQKPQRKVFKWIAIMLLFILLLVASYIAGYFRIVNIEKALTCIGTNNTNSLDAKLINKVSKSSKKNGVVSAKKHVIGNKNLQPPQTVGKENATVKTPAVELKRDKSNVEIAATKPIVKKPVLGQVPSGKYKIVGTKGHHTVQSGETIRQIAFAEYGSKGYALYIIVHNDIKNPDKVPMGAILKLPELEEK